MASRDNASITVTRGQLRAALGEWHSEAVREGTAYPVSDKQITDEADFLMSLCRQQGAE